MQIMYSNYYWVFEDRRAKKVHIHDNEKCINNPISNFGIKLVQIFMKFGKMPLIQLYTE